MLSFLRSIPSRIATALVGYVLVILVAGAWGGTALANAGEDSEDSFPLACAARDLDLVTLIELQGEAEVIAPSRLADNVGRTRFCARPPVTFEARWNTV